MWFYKILDNMQHNLAFIDSKGGIKFVDMAGYLFDELNYESIQIATEKLIKNGFKSVDELDNINVRLGMGVGIPDEILTKPYNYSKVYSSGQFWSE
tara:strand:- start:111 stop:398 length:288 start_codon:yes stop_codon:yes gene_type:complete